MSTATASIPVASVTTVPNAAVVAARSPAVPLSSRPACGAISALSALFTAVGSASGVSPAHRARSGAFGASRAKAAAVVTAALAFGPASAAAPTATTNVADRLPTCTVTDWPTCSAPGPVHQDGTSKVSSANSSVPPRRIG